MSQKFKYFTKNVRYYLVKMTTNVKQDFYEIQMLSYSLDSLVFDFTRTNVLALFNNSYERKGIELSFHIGNDEMYL